MFKTNINESLDNGGEHFSYDMNSKKIREFVVETFHDDGVTKKQKEIYLDEIDYVEIERYLGYLEIYFKNGNMQGSRITNFSTMGFRKLEKLEVKKD